MISFKVKEISYVSIATGATVTHSILMACQGDKVTLISHANLYLYSTTRSSRKTSERYCYILAMYYRFLSSMPSFQDKDFGLYHMFSSNKWIRRWQVMRQLKRIESGSARPSSATIYEDAKILMQYFRWLNTNGYHTNVKVDMVNWVANFKNNTMLNYLRRISKQRIDTSSIKVLDKINKQHENYELITPEEIKILLESYVDPVYPAIFLLALGTAMRPMDLCAFPFIGNGVNKHLMPFSDMNTDSASIKYGIDHSKGNKVRTIVINCADLRELESRYIKPLYKTRAKLYEQRTGHPCPPSILFLNAKGDPVTPRMISNITGKAKVRALKKHPDFRQDLDFYQSRHWWPTQLLINYFGDDLVTSKADVLYAAVAQAICDQMGHDDISTTYKHYVSLARLVTEAHKGKVQELITSPSETVQDFVALLDKRFTVQYNALQGA